ncbi:MAG: DUF4861 family protein [Chthoniobacteraceae bacterium]
MNILRASAFVLTASILSSGSLLAASSLTVTVGNDLAIARPAETIVVPWAQVAAQFPGTEIDHVRVLDAAGKMIPAQVTNFHPDEHHHNADDLIFQHDFAAGEKSATFTIEPTKDTVPPFPDQTFGRYVPERNDDFAWENDRIAHRIYGPKLETRPRVRTR